MVKDLIEHFPKKTYDGQQNMKRWLNITNYQGNVNQNP